MKIVAAICLFVFSCIYEQNWPYSWWPMATELTMGGDMAKYKSVCCAKENPDIGLPEGKQKILSREKAKPFVWVRWEEN